MHHIPPTSLGLKICHDKSEIESVVHSVGLGSNYTLVLGYMEYIQLKGRTYDDLSFCCCCAKSDALRTDNAEAMAAFPHAHPNNIPGWPHRQNQQYS